MGLTKIFLVLLDFSNKWFSCVACVCCRDCYTEKCVMNNYFGIGLDAKISLDFNNKRDEHPEKCRCASTTPPSG